MTDDVSRTPALFPFQTLLSYFHISQPRLFTVTSGLRLLALFTFLLLAAAPTDSHSEYIK